MRRTVSIFMALLIMLSIALSGCQNQQDPSVQAPGLDHSHTDVNDDGACDACSESVLVNFDIYVVNDLHGKLADSDNQPGVDELSTYLRGAQFSNENTILLSSGDMWQGSSESNLTKGNIMTDWMNDMGFVAMTLGNHEFDWGEDIILESTSITKIPTSAWNTASPL